MSRQLQQEEAFFKNLNEKIQIFAKELDTPLGNKDIDTITNNIIGYLKSSQSLKYQFLSPTFLAAAYFFHIKIEENPEIIALAEANEDYLKIVEEQADAYEGGLMANEIFKNIYDIIVTKIDVSYFTNKKRVKKESLEAKVQIHLYNYIALYHQVKK